MDIENRLPVGTMVMLNSKTLSKEDLAWKKWGDKPRKIIKIEDSWAPTIYEVDGLKEYIFEREWLIVVNPKSTCKFMKKKVQTK